MQTLKIDADNQLVVEQGGLKVINGIDAAAQDSRTRVGLYKGEDPFDVEKGIDFDSDLLGKMGGADYIRDLIAARITAGEDIESVGNVTLERDGNALNVTAEVDTIYGRINL